MQISIEIKVVAYQPAYPPANVPVSFRDFKQNQLLLRHQSELYRIRLYYTSTYDCVSTFNSSFLFVRIFHSDLPVMNSTKDLKTFVGAYSFASPF